jgi:hypothetical protein
LRQAAALEQVSVKAHPPQSDGSVRILALFRPCLVHSAKIKTKIEDKIELQLELAMILTGSLLGTLLYSFAKMLACTAHVFSKILGAADDVPVFGVVAHALARFLNFRACLFHFAFGGWLLRGILPERQIHSKHPRQGDYRNYPFHLSAPKSAFLLDAAAGD